VQQAFGGAVSRCQQRAGLRTRAVEHSEQFAVTREHAAQPRGKRGELLRLARQEMFEEARRAPHGLACVIEDVVEPWQPLCEKPREQFHARRVAKIQAVDLQARAKGGKIRLLRKSFGGIDRETRRDDDVGARAQ
jgi:hypothetical protein